ncbi:hypothetical protein N2152v2_000709 [Parachlorella kessleri]
MLVDAQPSNYAGSGAPGISKLKLDNLFLQWFSLPDSQQLVRLCSQPLLSTLYQLPLVPADAQCPELWYERQVMQLLEDVKLGRPVSASSPKKKRAAPNFSSSTPPLSPKKGSTPLSPFSPSRKSPTTPTPIKPLLSLPAIPQFYFPRGGRVAEHVVLQARSQAEAYLAAHPQGLTLDDLKAMLKQVFGLPSSLGYPLFYKIALAPDSLVQQQALLAWLQQHDFWSKPESAQAFDVLRQESYSYITPEDVRPVLAGILMSHPGLDFLQGSPEFQDRYAETVIYRIFYSLNRSGNGRLTLRELKRGDLLSALHDVDNEEDINRVQRYFSYEHFYVIYCKFWDLDQDHDLLLSRDDLLRYGNHALTFRIVDRVFAQAGRPFSSGTPGKMGYEDFCWFIMSEEDKSTDSSLEYWFRCVDLDGDGKLASSELLYFYEEQLHRMECLSQESVSFADVLSQMTDMLQPQDPGCFTLMDLKRSRALAGTLFNVLFNLNKFIAFETRDPFVVRQEREESGLSEWDRFARTEYVRLAVEEDGDDSPHGSWTQAVEAAL